MDLNEFSLNNMIKTWEKKPANFHMEDIYSRQTIIAQCGYGIKNHNGILCKFYNHTLNSSFYKKKLMLRCEPPTLRK